MLVALGTGCKKDAGDAPAPEAKSEPTQPAKPAPPADAERVSLLGVTLIAPDNAEELSSGLDHKRYFVADAQVLIDISVVPTGCDRALDSEWESWQRVRKDPAQAQLNRIVAMQRTDTAPLRGFSVEAFTRTPEEVKANRPEHPIALTFRCGDRASLSLTISQRSGTLTKAARELAAAVLESVKFP